MRVLLSQISPPLAVLFSGRPLLALLTPKWWLIPAPLVALCLLGAGHGILALILMVMWAWPSETAKNFAFITVQNKLEDGRFDRLIKSQERLMSSVIEPARRRAQPAYQEPDEDRYIASPDVGTNGTRFRRRS